MIRRLRQSGALFAIVVIGTLCWITAYNEGAKHVPYVDPSVPCAAPAVMSMPAGHTGQPWTCTDGNWGLLP